MVPPVVAGSDDGVDDSVESVDAVPPVDGAVVAWVPPVGLVDPPLSSLLHAPATRAIPSARAAYLPRLVVLTCICLLIGSGGKETTGVVAWRARYWLDLAVLSSPINTAQVTLAPQTCVQGSPVPASRKSRRIPSST